MLHLVRSLAVFLTVLFLAGACAKKPRNNPLDPKGEEYNSPQLVILTAPNNDDTLTTDVIDIEWSEFFSDKSEFQYRLDGGLFSGWGATTQFSRPLDEGKHTFQIQARYPDGKEIANQTLTFYVFALDTPAVYIYPRRYELGGDTAIVSVKTRALPSADVVHLVISGATLDSVVQRFDPANPSPANVDKSSGTVDIMVLGSIALKGDATLCDLYLRTLSDSATVTIDTCIVLQNTKPVTVREVRGGVLIRP